jgi:hypothetical protein
MISQYQKLSRKRKIALFAIEISIFFSVLYSTSYSISFLRTWFSTNFSDNFSLFLSLSLIFSSGVILFFGLVLYERSIKHEMIIDFPKEIPQNEYEKWKLLVAQIKIKARSQLYYLIMFLPSTYVGYILLMTSFWFVGYLAKNHFLDFINQFSTTQQPFLALGMLMAISLPVTILPMLVTINFANGFMSKYLGYPTDEDIIFAESFTINYRLFVKDRNGAKKELDALLKSLKKFSRNWLNEKRKAYSQEFSNLIGNKSALERLVLFTPEPLIDEIRELFLKIGLSLRNWDDPECLKMSQNLIQKLSGYKPSRRIQKIAIYIETYPRTITVLSIVASVVLFILGYPQIASLIKG